MRFWKPTQKAQVIANIDEWYDTETGQHLLSDLERFLAPVLSTSFGYYSLQIGCSSLSARLLENCRVKHQFSIGSLEAKAQIGATPSMLPIASDSVDLVILMHHLSNTREPHAVLREAFRILIPEGRLVIIDFNPLSLWGLRYFFQSWLDHPPFNGHYYTARRIDDWMRLLGFDQHRHERVGYAPPILQPSVTKHLSWLEKGTSRWLPVLSALNLMVYHKSISPMTPVRHRWATRRILPAKIARPTAGRGMRSWNKFDD